MTEEEEAKLVGLYEIQFDADRLPKGVLPSKLHAELADKLGDVFAHVNTSKADGEALVVQVVLTREPTDADRKAVAGVVKAHDPKAGPKAPGPFLVTGTVDGREVVAKIPIHTKTEE
jgi:hypothetical protein